MIEDQEDCMGRIEPILGVLHDCLLDGMAFYQNPENYSPEAAAQQRDRTAAGCVNDHAYHRLRERLDGVPGCHFLNVRGLDVLNYCDTALIRLKKVNGAGRARNLLTKQQEDYDAQVAIPGLPPEAARMIAGYQPDAIFSSVERVIISRPLGRTILWAAQLVMVEDQPSWIDITPPRLTGTERTDFDSGRRAR
jgi:hypothetical protein